MVKTSRSLAALLALSAAFVAPAASLSSVMPAPPAVSAAQVSGAGTSASVAHRPEMTTGTELQERLDAVVTVGAVGAMASVVDDHRTWRGTSGSAIVGTNEPPHGRFRAGSVTKTFVATVVLQLVAEHRLRLSDSVQRWLPGVVPGSATGGHQITIRQLLDHTSGLYDYLRTLPFPPSAEFWANRWRTWTPTELIARAVSHPPMFSPPGTAFSYSSTNYLLLGLIIEEATGHTYTEEIQRRIIDPLHLNGTELPGTVTQIRGPHPHGYLPSEGDQGRHDGHREQNERGEHRGNGDRGGQVQLIDYTAMNPSVMGASGEMISTTTDLDRFFTALLGGALLPPRLLDEMKTPGVPGADYGLGLAWRETSCDTRVYGNDGDALAYQAWSYTNTNLRHRVTLAFTPNSRADTDASAEAFLDQAVCG